jgi:hypothetical protein
MPGAHRDTDSRFCGAKTIVSNQSTVFVNGLLWAVEDDKDTHCNEGALQAVYGPPSVYIEGKKVIVAVGDIAAPDRQACFIEHPTGPTNPKGRSPDTYCYGGAGGGS